MSNEIDFFQSTHTSLSLPGSTVSVFVDGVLCPYLEPIEIVRCGWPEFSFAKLAYNPAGHTPLASGMVEEIEAELAMGKQVCIRQVYNGCAPDSSVVTFPIFEGQIEAIETDFGPEGQTFEVNAKDFSANLLRICAYGQRVGEPDGSTVVLTGADTIFNADGKPNATKKPAAYNGDVYTVFCAEPSAAKYWDCAEVIYYLLCEYLAVGQLHIPSMAQLVALTGDTMVRDLAVTGLNMVNALHCCCELAGLEFRFVPRLAPSGPREAIVFYRPGRGQMVELNCQPAGERLSISKTDVARLHSRKNFWPVTHKYVGQGHSKIYEATFDLIKAWDPEDENTGYDNYSPLTSADFYKVKDVYRKWCLNEAGEYSGAPYNQGDAFDFSQVFESGSYVRRRRRFWPMLTRDSHEKSLGYFLQVSFDDGLHWWQYLYAYNNLLDECGLWLSSDRLDVNTWIAALKGVLKFRITASVVSDERLSCWVADGPVNSTAPVIEHILPPGGQFKYRKVSGSSIFANSSDGSLGMPDEADDSAALYEFVRKKAEVASETIEMLDVQTPWLAFDFQVGDRVTSSPESRDLLGCQRDNRSSYRIKRVRMDFRKQCTNLKIVRHRRCP
ncbi:MAG: hypothetical protein ACYTBJ_15610 [Planctomycetota bacterium]|jgi:hypothetical protein